MVKRILNKYGHPPDMRQEVVKTVLRQAGLPCAEWVSAAWAYKPLNIALHPDIELG